MTLTYKVTVAHNFEDECSGWQVIVGKSFASSISYSTKYIFFMDLLENCNKTFLIFKTQWYIVNCLNI